MYMKLSKRDFKSSIWYNVRLASIHVAVFGKSYLIDFGQTDCTNNEERKRNDLKSLYRIFGKYGKDGKYGSDNHLLPKFLMR